EVAVSRRGFGGITGYFDVQRGNIPAALPAGSRIGIPLHEPARQERVYRLGGGAARAPRDGQQRVDVEEAVDPRKEIRLLRRQRKILVSRHRIPREPEDA